MSTRTPARPGPLHPAQVSPIHLPALSLVASDIDGLDAPVKIVNPTALDRCNDCAAGDDVPELDAIATVVAYDNGFRYFLASCALHLVGTVRHYRSHGWHTVVEVPTCSRQWFERSDRETYWAVDESRGIAATRGIVSGAYVRRHYYRIVSGFAAKALPFGSVLVRAHNGRPVPGAHAVVKVYGGWWAYDAQNPDPLGPDVEFVVLHIPQPEMVRPVIPTRPSWRGRTFFTGKSFADGTS